MLYSNLQFGDSSNKRDDKKQDWNLILFIKNQIEAQELKSKSCNCNAVGFFAQTTCRYAEKIQ